MACEQVGGPRASQTVSEWVVDGRMLSISCNVNCRRNENRCKDYLQIEQIISSKSGKRFEGTAKRERVSA